MEREKHKRKKLKSKWFKIIFFGLLILLAIFLCLNRFGCPIDITSYETEYCQNSEIRHWVEHFVWAFFIPIIFIILIKLITCFSFKCWTCSFIISAVIIIIVQIYRILEYGNVNFIQLLRLIPEILGLIISFFYIKNTLLPFWIFFKKFLKKNKSKILKLKFLLHDFIP